MTSVSTSTELRRNLRRIYSDAIAFSVMVGAGETYLAAFVLALGMGELAAGLVASIPMLAGAFLQLISPAAVRRLGSHRRWVVLCAIAQASSFIPLTAAALYGRIHVAAVFAIAALYWGAGMATGPAWSTWAGTLIPRRIRPRYFAKRSRVAHMAVLCGLVLGGIGLQVGSSFQKPLIAFAILFAVAGSCRFISASLLSSQTEPVPPDQNHREVPWRELVARLRHSPDGRLLIYMIVAQFTVQISGPYFTPYMLGQLKLSYAQYLLLIATSYTSRIAVLPMLGAIVRRVGARRVLCISGLGILPLSVLWIFSTSIIYLFFVQLIAGAVWAAYELTTLLLLFETIREEERTSVLTTFNLANAVATVCGAGLGGYILSRLGTDHSAYMSVFIASGIARLGTLALLIRAVRVIPFPSIPATPVQMPTSSVAVRPNLGAIERPVLPGMSFTQPTISPARSMQSEESLV